MTTIAYSHADKHMACDSLWTEGDTIATQQTKIERLRSGVLVGYAGDNDSRWLHENLARIRRIADLPHQAAIASIKADCTALLVFPSGAIFVVQTASGLDERTGDGGLGITPITWPFWAIGTGGSYAIGAMMAGKSAREAVRIACRLDPFSRLPMHQLALHPTTDRKCRR